MNEKDNEQPWWQKEFTGPLGEKFKLGRDFIDRETDKAIYFCNFEPDKSFMKHKERNLFPICLKNPRTPDYEIVDGKKVWDTEKKTTFISEREDQDNFYKKLFTDIMEMI